MTWWCGPSSRRWRPPTASVVADGLAGTDELALLGGRRRGGPAPRGAGRPHGPAGAGRGYGGGRAGQRAGAGHRPRALRRPGRGAGLADGAPHERRGSARRAGGGAGRRRRSRCSRPAGGGGDRPPPSRTATPRRARTPWSTTDVDEPLRRRPATSCSDPPTSGPRATLHPVITWGNGSFAHPWEYDPFLRHLASWGFVVIASTSTRSAPARRCSRRSPTCARWPRTPTTALFGHVDLEHVGAAGPLPGRRRIGAGRHRARQPHHHRRSPSTSPNEVFAFPPDDKVFDVGGLRVPVLFLSGAERPAHLGHRHQPGVLRRRCPPRRGWPCSPAPTTTASSTAPAVPRLRHGLDALPAVGRPAGGRRVHRRRTPSCSRPRAGRTRPSRACRPPDPRPVPSAARALPLTGAASVAALALAGRRHALALRSVSLSRLVACERPRSVRSSTLATPRRAIVRSAPVRSWSSTKPTPRSPPAPRP